MGTPLGHRAHGTHPYSPCEDEAVNTLLPTNRPVWARSLSAGVLAAGILVVLAGCGSSAPDPTGVWAASDGSATKTIGSNGACTGMYYNAGQPLDIGGPQTCTFSTQKASDGTYTVVVAQPPNQATYRVSFTGKNTMRLLDPGTGSIIVTLTRQ